MRNRTADEHRPAQQCPQDAHPGAIGQQPETLDDQVDLVIGQRTPIMRAICVHAQIVPTRAKSGTPPTAGTSATYRPCW